MINKGVVYRATQWPTNAHMIADVAKLGYLRKEWLTLDPTYGLGNFWKVWRPDELVCTDIIKGTDFRNLPFTTGHFDAVVYDPPYKMNGTPTDWVDGRYGVGISTRWQDRLALMVAGVPECIRVMKPKGVFIVKCQDQVVSGKVVWQTDIMTEMAKREGLRKVDRLDFLTNPREQPHDRQVHARTNYSTLLVFRRD